MSDNAFEIICDHCHKPIEDAREAVKCTRVIPPGRRPDFMGGTYFDGEPWKEYLPGTFHSGACADAAIAADKTQKPAAPG